jgi:hypothetical protein
MSRFCNSLIVVSAAMLLSAGCKQRTLNEDSQFNAVPILNGQYTDSPALYLYLNEQNAIQGFDCGDVSGEITDVTICKLVGSVKYDDAVAKIRIEIANDLRSLRLKQSEIKAAINELEQGYEIQVDALPAIKEMKETPSRMYVEAIETLQNMEATVKGIEIELRKKSPSWKGPYEKNAEYGNYRVIANETVSQRYV